MSEKKFLDHMYIIDEELKLTFQEFDSNQDVLDRACEIFSHKKYKEKTLLYFEHIDYLNVENLNRINKLNKENKEQAIIKKINKEHLTTIFKILGFNIIYCSLISERILEDLYYLLNIKYEKIKQRFDYFKTGIVLTQNVFFDIAKNVIRKITGNKTRIKKYFHLSYLIVNKNIPLIILLGGTSGTGKSTLASLLASRLGISTVLSTDSIRHIMRNFLNKNSSSVLFASTYEAHKQLTEEKWASLGDNNKRIIEGYLQQSNLVNEQLSNVIEKLIQRRESVVLEGVHLTGKIIKDMMEKYKYTLPFIVYISKSEKHKERFAVRSKLMTLESKHNKYVENFDNIRVIQNYIIKKAERYQIPTIDNNNIDKSLGVIQDTILRALFSIYSGSKKSDLGNINNLLNSFNKVSKDVMSSKDALKLIKQKVNKNFLLEKFFKNESESGIQKNNENDSLDTSIEKNPNNFEITSSNIVLRQTNRKDYSSEPDIRNPIKTENKEQFKKEANFGVRVNNFRESKRKDSGSIKKGKKFKSMVPKMFNKDNMEESDKSIISDSLNKNASVESDQERIRVINETEDEFESLSEKEDSVGSIDENSNKQVEIN